ncbi:MAG: FkbM family methyltransferase [Bacteroidota bacterium]
MKDFISFYFKSIYFFLTDSNFRTFSRLFLFDIGKKRNTEYTVRFNGHKFSVADMKSFVWQYYEIFVNQFYSFNANSENPVIYDCGANIGTSVLFFANSYPKAKIVAFEASPYIYGILKKNIDNNNIKNVVLNQKAVWTKNEELEFSDEGGDSGSIYSIANTKKVKVQAIDFLEALNKEAKIDMLKMDIEGAENDVIPHIASALYKVDRMFIEYHSFNNGEQRLDEILLLLRKNKFRYYIRHVNNRKSPFIDISKDKDMDMQLNIFAYKI